VTLTNCRPHAPIPASFAEEVADYLQRTPRQLPSKYFYDALGSALFDAICLLPWYRITRAESALLDRYAREIVAPLQRPLTLAELGCGNGEKLGVLATRAAERFQSVQLVDISPAALYAAGAARVAAHRSRRGAPATYEQGCRSSPARAAMPRCWCSSSARTSATSIPAPARDMLVRIRASLREGDALLLGSDLVEAEARSARGLRRSAAGDRAFNRNLLRASTRTRWHLRSRSVDASRGLERRARRVEMHLVSRVRSWSASARRISTSTSTPTSGSGPRARTSTTRAVSDLGRRAGFRDAEQWIDERRASR
jgi:uncharacterized SAM-dependent methyltransferase